MKDEGLPAGSLVGRYVVVGRVGAGGTGVVHAAYDPQLDRKVALKLLRQTAADQGRLVAEAKAIARLSHPNVVSVFDVGTIGETVFLAMEFLGGGTLREWLASGPRRTGEVVAVFGELARALAAAHAAGIVHRDFKPDNVLFDGAGRPKVVDFGLARLLGDLGDLPDEGGIGSAANATAMAGTPAYMAPEQFLGEPLDGHTDQFAFCVALHEALYGTRPFEGEALLALAAAVTAGRVREAPTDTRVPGWLRRIIVRGLSVAKGDRFASMEELARALARDPRAKLRRRLLVAGGVAALAAAALPGVSLMRRHRALERAIDGHLADARAALAEAARDRPALERREAAAFALFDRRQMKEGEAAWSAAELAAAAIERAATRASQRAEAALLLDGGRAASRALLADALYERASFDLDRHGEITPDLLQRLALYDDEGHRRARLDAPARLAVTSPHPEARATLEVFRRGPEVWAPLEGSSPLPLARTLPPGSYRVVVAAPGRLTVTYPLLLRRASQAAVTAALPPAAEIPAGFVLVPAGEFLMGSTADPGFRRDLQRAAPLHRVTGGPFLIARQETTYRDWIEYLRALPPAERARRTPRSSSIGLQGDVELRALPDGDWELRLQPGTVAASARTDQRLRYTGRAVRQEQDWLTLPVSGVSWEDAAAYAAWLDASGRVPGARLCTDAEWEQAARGADGRPFPHGWRLAPGDVNYSETWGDDPRAFGPDAVGSYPRSRSPHGIDDMAGNVWEWVRQPGEPATAARGGAFPFDSNACRTELRQLTEPTLRDITAGVRVCADLRPR